MSRMAQPIESPRTDLVQLLVDGLYLGQVARVDHGKATRSPNPDGYPAFRSAREGSLRCFGLPEHVTRGSGRQARAVTWKKAVSVDLSRQQIVKQLRRAGLNEIAGTAETELPDPVPAKVAEQFCAAEGLSTSMLMDRMGGSP